MQFQFSQSMHFSRLMSGRLVLCLVLLCGLYSSCVKSLPQRNVFYENDFEREDTSRFEISNIYGIVDSLKIESFNGSKVLGRFNSHLVRLKIDTPPTHNTIKIEFDLYIHDKWDGDYIPPGSTIPDAWIMKVDDYPVYITTFSNGPYNQSFPNNYEGHISNGKPRSNAWGVLPGVCANAGQPDGTTHYKIEYTTTHAGSLELALSDVLQPFNSPCLKSWSIDNLRLTAISYN